MASTTDGTINETLEPSFITITRNYNPDFDRNAFLSTLGLAILEPPSINIEKIPIVPIGIEENVPVVPIAQIGIDQSAKGNTTKKKTSKSDAPASKQITRRIKLIKQTGDAGVSSTPSTQVVIPPNSYYMNNRNIFTKSIMDMFGKKSLTSIDKVPVSCEQNNEEFSLMTHQKIVREYLQTFSPYRGLLLFHGLGSGKTCSAIAIAEGNKHTKRIIIMSPASLHTNFYEELKRCIDKRTTGYFKHLQM